jgi:hypothetical protein
MCRRRRRRRHGDEEEFLIFLAACLSVYPEPEWRLQNRTGAIGRPLFCPALTVMRASFFFFLFFPAD